MESIIEIGDLVSINFIRSKFVVTNITYDDNCNEYLSLLQYVSDECRCVVLNNISPLACKLNKKGHQHDN